MSRRRPTLGFLAEAHAWIRSHVTPTGEIEQPHVRAWSTVMRVPTADGPVWFKANEEAQKHEAALVVCWRAERPDAVPPLARGDLERGWMLMADAGERLRELVARERSLARFLDVLPLYASVQVDVARSPTSWSRSACPTCGSRCCRRSTRRCWTSSRPARRGRGAAARQGAVGAEGKRGAGRIRDPGDDPARRLPRRPDLRQGRQVPPDGLGRRVRLASVLHAGGDAGGRDRVGRRRRGELGGHRAVPGRVPRPVRRLRHAGRTGARGRAGATPRLGLPCRQRGHPGRHGWRRTCGCACSSTGGRRPGGYAIDHVSPACSSSSNSPAPCRSTADSSCCVIRSS